MKQLLHYFYHLGGAKSVIASVGGRKVSGFEEDYQEFIDNNTMIPTEFIIAYDKDDWSNRVRATALRAAFEFAEDTRNDVVLIHNGYRYLVTRFTDIEKLIESL